LGVTSLASAKAWLQAERGKTFTATNVEGVKAEAAEKYGVEFPDW
jgi:hypothetical protein